MKNLLILPFLLLIPKIALSYEPLSPFDDVFGSPANTMITESAVDFPGAESFAGKRFAVLGYKVPYGIDEFASTTLAGGINFRKVGIFASLNSGGFELYGEEQEKIGVSYNPYKFISIGARITRNSMRIKGFGEADAIGGDIGIILKPTERLYFSASMDDITGVELGDSKEPVDSKKRFSVSWEAPGGFTMLAKSVKTERFDSSFSGGFTIDMFKVLTLGAGGGNKPDRVEFICGINISDLRFIYRGSNHQELGMAHGFTMNWTVQ